MVKFSARQTNNNVGGFQIVASGEPAVAPVASKDATDTAPEAEKAQQPIFGDIQGKPYCFDPANKVFYCITSENKAVILDNVTELPTFLNYNGDIFICASGRESICHTELTGEKNAVALLSDWQAVNIIEGDESANAVTYFHNSSTGEHIIGNVTPRGEFNINVPPIIGFKPHPDYRVFTTHLQGVSVMPVMSQDGRTALIWVKTAGVMKELTFLGKPDDITEKGTTGRGVDYFHQNGYLYTAGEVLHGRDSSIRTIENATLFVYRDDMGGNNFHFIGEGRSIQFGARVQCADNGVDLFPDDIVWTRTAPSVSCQRFAKKLKNPLHDKKSSKKDEKIHITYKEIIDFMRKLT